MKLCIETSDLSLYCAFLKLLMGFVRQFGLLLGP
jgi:hypothetical protein